jgi:GT2 family glycosyltransferase
MSGKPRISVIVLNYNGAHFLPVCLDSLQSQSYPKDDVEVIVADNGSTDESLELLREDYSWVRVLENQANLGFASGNNRAISHSKGDYIVLINNDTQASSRWLESLVEVADKNPRAGIVTGRLRLFYHQIDVKIVTESFTPEDDFRELGVMISDVDPRLPRSVVQYLDGFYGWETFGNHRRFRWTQREAILGIPVPRDPMDVQCFLRLTMSRPHDSPVAIQISAEGEVLASCSLHNGISKVIELFLSEDLVRKAQPLVQNTGSIVFKDGSGRDRGTYVKNYEMYYEIDRGQYDDVELVFGGCGANMLLRMEMLEEVGSFDDDFFMYYEDTDLSWRARLMDWNVLYAPNAIVYHIHCGTTVEWSPEFLYLVDRNRLAMVFKNGSFGQIVYAWGRFIARTVWELLLKVLKPYVKKNVSVSFRVRIKILLKLIAWLPPLLRKRWKIQSRRRLAASELQAWFVE